MYGRETAEDTRPGHTPSGLKEKLRQEAWAALETDSSSESEELETPSESVTPQSCYDGPVTLLENELRDRAEAIPGRKRKREEDEDICSSLPVAKRQKSVR